VTSSIALATALLLVVVHIRSSHRSHWPLLLVSDAVLTAACAVVVAVYLDGFGIPVYNDDV
jgi:hypothetical protein